MQHESGVQNQFGAPSACTLEEALAFHCDMIRGLMDHRCTSSPGTDLEQGQRAVVALLGTCVIDQTLQRHRPLVLRLLAGSHALRVILCTVKIQGWRKLFRQWWSRVMASYVVLGYPKLEMPMPRKEQSSWDDVRSHIAAGTPDLDGLRLLGTRALYGAALSWGDIDFVFLNTAFDLWSV